MSDEVPDEFYDTDHIPHTVQAYLGGLECEQEDCVNTATLEIRSHEPDGGGFNNLCGSCAYRYYAWLTGKGEAP